MIHKIEPHRYYPEFRIQAPAEQDYLFIFEGDQIYLSQNKEERLSIPTFSQMYGILQEKYSLSCLFSGAEYLFSIDDRAFYRICAADQGIVPTAALSLFPPKVFRGFSPEYLAFAGITACQINRFRLQRRFCGRCGHRTKPGSAERSMVCPECGMVEYPKISPAVITAVTDGDRLLLTKYAAGSYKNWALVAGFVEVGETFKAAVRREVMEEVGLKVKNVTYYKSQPWSFSDSAMIGFFAELDGEDNITLQEEELSTARWFHREEIPDPPSDISIGQEMIEFFRNGKNPFN